MKKRIPKKRISRKLKVSKPPGTLLHIGERKAETLTSSLIAFNKDEVETLHPADSHTLEKKPGRNHWFSLSGLHDVETIRKIGCQYGVHELILEDVLNTMHRSKFENLEDYLFVILKQLQLDKTKQEITTDQISFILLSDSLLVFHEGVSDIFLPVKVRLEKGLGRIRRSGTDYLLYALIDSVVDNYYIALESLGQEIEELEILLWEESTPDILRKIHTLKQNLITFRKAAAPLREVINKLSKSESKLVDSSTELYFRDVYDHIVQITEMLEIYREMISGMQDFYLSSVSNKMNEVMKVLTIIATIFIPLTFIAGVYGMNFEVMPELKIKSGYFIILGIMAALAVAMLRYFKKKKWL